MKALVIKAESASPEYMKTDLVLALIGSAISFALPTFGQQKDTVDPESIGQLQKEDKNFEEAYNKTMPLPSPRFSPTTRFW
jgi:hypothetical protein